MNARAFTSDSGLIFQWESPYRRKLAIAAFVGVSMFAHGFCFYLFQIVYQPAVALLPPPARVNIIAANTEEGRTLLRWMEAEDPALASITQRSPDAKPIEFPKLEYLPSYVSMQPSLKQLPPTVSDLGPPSSQPPGPVPTTRTRITPRIFAVQTSITLSSELASLGMLQQPQMKWSASTREAPQNAEFRVAVTGYGLLRYCLLETSSGDAALDEQARKYLAMSRFTEGWHKTSVRSELVWGIATVEWGNDVTFPTASPSEAKAP